APLALAALWLAFALGHTPPGQHRPTSIVSQPGTPPRRRELEATPRQPLLARNPGNSKPSAPAGPRHHQDALDPERGADADRKAGATSNRGPLPGREPRRGRRSHLRAWPRVAAASHRPAEPRRRQAVPTAPADRHPVRSPGAPPAAERPIERLVIQV